MGVMGSDGSSHLSDGGPSMIYSGAALIKLLTRSTYNTEPGESESF